MIEFLQTCFAPVNLPFTVLMILVFGYWILVIVGGLGLDAFDVDVDADVDAGVDVDAGADVDVGTDLDADVDVDADADAEVATGSGGGMGGAMLGVLRFFNLGEVPLMVVASFFIASMWVVALLTNTYVNSTFGVLVTLAWFVPNVILSALVAKVMTMPLKILFRHVHSGIAEQFKAVGKTCFVRTLHVDETSGQAEIRIEDGAPLLINVRATSEERLAKGDQALVVAHDARQDTYRIVRFDVGN